MSSKTNLNPGDVLVARLPDGRYRAVRILKVQGKSSVVCTTPFLSDQRPALTDPLLKKGILQHRFFFEGQPATSWVDGRPPACFEHLGNLPLTAKEAKLECNCYSGSWTETTGIQAFLEWRWEHDRAAFEAEVQAEEQAREQARGARQTPKKMLGEKVFWAIIALLDWKKTGNDAKVLKPAVKALAERSDLDICRFEERLTYFLYQLDTKAHASNIGEDSLTNEDRYFSADGFLYARCVVVANGRAYYKAVLKDPTQMPKDMEFEALLYLAREAYELKTGETMDYVTGCSYESFSNAEGWK